MKATGFSFLLGLCAYGLNLLLPGAIAAVPLAVALVKYQPLRGVWAFVLFTLGCLLYPGPGIVPAAAMSAITAVALWYAANTFECFAAYMIAAAGTLLGLFVWMQGLALMAPGFMDELLQELLALMDEIAASASALYTGELLDQFLANFTQMREMVLEIYRNRLGELAVGVAFYSGVPALVVVRALCKKAAGAKQSFVFYNIPRTPGLVIILCAVAANIAGAYYQQVVPIALALQALFSYIYALQGLSVLIFMLKKYKLGKGALAAATLGLILLSGLLPFMHSMLLILGVLETFFKFRLRMSGAG